MDVPFDYEISRAPRRGALISELHNQLEMLIPRAPCMAVRFGKCSVHVRQQFGQRCEISMNKAFKRRSFTLASFGGTSLLLSLGVVCNAIAGGGEYQVCDVGADYSLGVEDYSEAIRLHSEIVRKHPENPFAHCHQGLHREWWVTDRRKSRRNERVAALGLGNERSEVLRSKNVGIPEAVSWFVAA
jgi:hypothetical protein